MYHHFSKKPMLSLCFFLTCRLAWLSRCKRGRQQSLCRRFSPRPPRSASPTSPCPCLRLAGKCQWQPCGTTSGVIFVPYRMCTHFYTHTIPSFRSLFVCKQTNINMRSAKSTPLGENSFGAVSRRQRFCGVYLPKGAIEFTYPTHVVRTARSPHQPPLERKQTL